LRSRRFCILRCRLYTFVFLYSLSRRPGCDITTWYQRVKKQGRTGIPIAEGSL